jgi:hypothetical protein
VLITKINMRQLLICISFLLPSLAYAHGGGLDSQGCHHNRKTGDYHCHRSPPAASPDTIASQRPMPARLMSAEPPDQTCYTGPRGGRYRIVNGKKRYGC